MNHTYRLAAVLALGLALVSPAVAQAPAQQQEAASAPAATVPPGQQATREQVARLFEVMRLRTQLQSAMKMIPAMMQQQIQAQARQIAAKNSGSILSTPEYQAAYAKLLAKYMQKAVGIITADEMVDDMTAIYQRHVSGPDVEAIIAFYSSPAGQRLLDLQPVIMREYMPVIMTRARERSQVIGDEMAGELQELIKSQTPAPKTPAAK